MDYVELNIAPTSVDDYDNDERTAKRMKELLLKRFIGFNHITLKVVKVCESHLQYHELRCCFEEYDCMGSDQAYFIRDNMPETWNDNTEYHWDEVGYHVHTILLIKEDV